MMLVQKLRLRALALLVALGLGVIGAVSLASLPVWPVVGVAVTAAALVMNRMASRLDGAVCWGCGGTIADQPAGEYGVTCSACGTINQRIARSDAASDRRA